MNLLNKLIMVVQFAISNYQVLIAAAFDVVAAICALCVSLGAFFTIVPGEQPEKAIRSFADWISRYSKK